jgi:anti-sigma B factor antagonist
MTAQPPNLEQQGPTVVATVEQPDMDLAAMQELCVSLEEKMRYDGARNFVFDLTAVNYLASACLGCLVQFMQDIQHARGKIALAGCSDELAFLFKVTRLDHVFAMFDEVDDALASI